MKDCPLNKKNKKAIFDFFKNNLTESITTYFYFVNWQKVFKNIEKIDFELNLLNSLIGKRNKEFDKKAKELFLKYPSVIKAIPYLLAIREKSLKILVDTESLLQKEFDFSEKNIDKEKISDLILFIKKTGLYNLLSSGEIKNLYDYVTGVEVGLDTNGRKNRTGKLMEYIVENFISKACLKTKTNYLKQATKKKIKKEWGLDIKIDRSSKKIDFVLLTQNKKLIFIETNFYSGGGSKLKSTAGEYITMSRFWRKQGIEFIWITDGYGWKNTLKPLEEFFDENTNLLNLKMLQKGCLEYIIKQTTRNL